MCLLTMIKNYACCQPPLRWYVFLSFSRRWSGELLAAAVNDIYTRLFDCSTIAYKVLSKLDNTLERKNG